MPRKPITVLFCENNIDGTIGGSYYSLLFLVKGLDRTRFTPIVVFYTEHTLLPAFRDAGIETIIWPRSRAFTFGAAAGGALRWIKPPVLMLQKLLNFGRGFVAPSVARAAFLRKRGIGLVHLNNSVLVNHPWMLAARLAGIKCVTHERGINQQYPASARYFGRHLDAIICISRAVEENFRDRGFPMDNVLTIHNGLDPDALAVQRQPDAVRASLGIAPDAPVVVMVGNIREWKGQHTLVAALDVVRRAHPAVRCVLVGATSPADVEYEHRLKAQVSSLGLQEHVIFTGFHSRPAEFLMMGDVIVHASVDPEPFGRVILEAMACKKPVVASRSGAIQEIVDEGKTGLTFTPGDADALAAAIRSLIGNPAEAACLGRNGYQRLVREFHINLNVQATQELYAKLFLQHGRSRRGD